MIISKYVLNIKTKITCNCNITTFVISTQVKVKTSLSIGKISFKCEHKIIDVEVT